MTKEETLIMEGLNIQLSKLALGMQELKNGIAEKLFIDSLPEWITLEKAVALKGGGTLSSYRNKLFLQPCCGTNARLQAGRRVWNKADILEWLKITDFELKAYAEKWKVKIPEIYKKRSA
jgi:hypothetical protein